MNARELSCFLLGLVLLIAIIVRGCSRVVLDRSSERMICTGGASPIVVDGRIVGCQRRFQ